MSSITIKLKNKERQLSEAIAHKRGFRTANDWLYNIIVRAISDEDITRRSNALLPPSIPLAQLTNEIKVNE
jgi:hypothetical protein